jgi:hypothetical protein
MAYGLHQFQLFAEHIMRGYSGENFLLGSCAEAAHAAPSGSRLGGFVLCILFGRLLPGDDFDRTAIDRADFGHGEALA